jgi:hypothetical protein
VCYFIFEGVGGYKGATNRRGAPHGKGEGVLCNGNHYEGDWVDGKMEGHGVGRWTDGEVYEGQWKGGERNGKGTEVRANGN